MKTTAADRFTDEILMYWDSFDCYETTARLGLSDTDSDALREMCDEAGEDYAEAEGEVLEWVRGMTKKLSIEVSEP